MDEVQISQYDRYLIEQLIHGININLPSPDKAEITEENISSIEYAASSAYNRDLHPVGGTAKWFRDELGQLWVKVKIQTSRSGTPEDRIHDKTVVIPASRVVGVHYNSHPRA